MQSIGNQFNNPFDYDLKLEFENRYLPNRALYINTKKAAKCSTFLAGQIQGSWKGKSSVKMPNSNFQFVVYFSFLRFLYTGDEVTGVIESQWVNQLLELAIVSGTSALRDLCLHTIVDHIDNGIQTLILSNHFDTLSEDRFSNLTVANSYYHLEIVNHLKDEEQTVEKEIMQFLAIKSLDTARQVLNILQITFGEFDSNEGKTQKGKLMGFLYCEINTLEF